MSTAAPCGRMFAEHGEGGGGQLWAAEVRPGCDGVAGGWVRARIRELLRPFPRMPATANRGADRLAVAIP
jgi:hypothetical protein